MLNEINQSKTTRAGDNTTDQKKESDNKTNQEKERFHKNLLSNPSEGQGHDPYSGLSANDKTKMNNEIVNRFSAVIKGILEESRTIKQPSESPMTVGDIIERHRRENLDQMLAKQLTIQEQIDSDYQFARNLSRAEAIVMPLTYEYTAEPSDIVFKNNITAYMIHSQEAEQSSNTKSIKDAIGDITTKDLDETIHDVKKERNDALQEDMRNNPNTDASEILKSVYKRYDDTLGALELIRHELSCLESRPTKTEKNIFLEDLKMKYEESTSTDNSKLISITEVKTAIEVINKFNHLNFEKPIVIDYTKLKINNNDNFLRDMRTRFLETERKCTNNDVKRYYQANARKINKILKANEDDSFLHSQELNWLDNTEFNGTANEAVESLLESLKTPNFKRIKQTTSSFLREYATGIEQRMKK